MARNAIRIALVLTVAADATSEDYVKTVDSIRMQRLMPWYIRVVYEGMGHPLPHATKSALQSFSNLRYFCPNVLGMYSERQLPELTAYNDLHGEDFDVYVKMPVGLVLKPRALLDLTEPFYDPSVNEITGEPKHLEYDHPWSARFVYKFFPILSPARKLFAYRRSYIDAAISG